jgi:hypothetical protein
MTIFDLYILPCFLKFPSCQRIRKRSASNLLLINPRILGLPKTPRQSNGEGSLAPAIGQGQSGNFAIEAVWRQTMIGMRGCEFPDR